MQKMFILLMMILCIEGYAISFVVKDAYDVWRGKIVS